MDEGTAGAARVSVGQQTGEAVSRRRFGRAVLLGGAGAGAAAVTAMGAAPMAGAAPVTDTWKLGGNSGVNEGTNFIGTKDNHALVVRTNNVERMRVHANGRVVVGGTPTYPTLFSSATTAGIYAILARSGFDGIYGTGTRIGVRGDSNGGANGAGVYGDGGTPNPGVRGNGYQGAGVEGRSSQGDGVSGLSISGSTSRAGVRGESTGINSNGVIGKAENGSSSFGVWGVSASGYAGYFSGRVHVSGTLSKGAGSFKIDHPLDPDGKYLSHSFVESPDMMNVYNGNVRTDGKGEATVALPHWFEALNRDFRYQLTPIGQFAQAMVATEIAGGSFTIRTDKPNVKVSWQVTGIRQDAFANANRIPAEEDKPRGERGTRLHPEAFGLAPDVGLQHARLAGLAAAVGAATAPPSPEGS
jgi:hypothetical protein